MDVFLNVWCVCDIWMLYCGQDTVLGLVGALELVLRSRALFQGRSRFDICMYTYIYEFVYTCIHEFAFSSQI